MRQKEKIRKPGTNLLQNKNIMDAEMFFFNFMQKCYVLTNLNV